MIIDRVEALKMGVKEGKDVVSIPYHREEAKRLAERVPNEGERLYRLAYICAVSGDGESALKCRIPKPLVLAKRCLGLPTSVSPPPATIATSAWSTACGSIM